MTSTPEPMAPGSPVAVVAHQLQLSGSRASPGLTGGSRAVTLGSEMNRTWILLLT